MMQGVRLSVQMRDPAEQCKREGDYAILCMEAKDYNVHFGGPNCPHAVGGAYLSTADEKCYTPHRGD